jgi:hypothetical protein
VELNKKPVISASELKNANYHSEMLNLVSDDSQRQQRKTEIIAEVQQIRNNKLEAVRKLITAASEILNKSEVTKEECETAINDLKTLANAPKDSAKQMV